MEGRHCDEAREVVDEVAQEEARRCDNEEDDGMPVAARRRIMLRLPEGGM
jgi:hypothetical protein